MGRDDGTMVGEAGALPFEFAARRRAVPWAIAVSATLHIGLALVLYWVPLKPLVVPPPTPVTVTILTPAEVAALSQPPAPDAPVISTPAPGAIAEPALQAAVPAEQDDPRLPVRPPTSAMTVASTLYAGAVLLEPSMRRVREGLKTLASSEQVHQLCNIEGLEQLRQALPAEAPDTLVPYALADMSETGLSLVASGGAFRSRRRWFAVSYKCDVAPDLKSVTAFAFLIGDEIPPSEWEAHDLNAADEDE